MDFAAIAGFRLWRGHFGAHGLDALLPVAPIRITMLRQPVALAYSRYRYIRRDPGTRLHPELTARRLSFIDFLRWGPAVPLLHNPQCRSLSFALDPQLSRAQLLTLLAGPDPDAAVKAHALTLTDATQYERALACLQQMPWFGLTERFNDSAAALARWLGVTDRAPLHLLDGGDAQAEAINNEALELIAAHSALDQRLYDFAAQRFQERVLYSR